MLKQLAIARGSHTVMYKIYRADEVAWVERSLTVLKEKKEALTHTKM